MAKPKAPEISFVVQESAPVSRLDVFLSSMTGLSRAYIQEQITSERILVNGKRVKKSSVKLHSQDLVTGSFSAPEELDLEPIAGRLDILFEDEHLLAVNKPQGMVVHPARGHSGPTLVHHLLYHLKSNPEFTETSPTRPGIVHRLDRGTSGVILVAKDRQTHELVSKAFRSRKVKKEYEAIVWGVPPEKGRFESTIGRDIRDRKKMSSHTKDGRLAITDFQTLKSAHHFSHVALFPFTGRTHQLRVHLAENKHPVLGDPMYGPASPPDFESINPLFQRAIEGLSETLLHARSLSFVHPITQESLTLEAQHPALFEKFLMLMRNFDK